MHVDCFLWSTNLSAACGCMWCCLRIQVLDDLQLSLGNSSENHLISLCGAASSEGSVFMYGSRSGPVRFGDLSQPLHDICVHSIALANSVNSEDCAAVKLDCVRLCLWCSQYVSGQLTSECRSSTSCIASDAVVRFAMANTGASTLACVLHQWPGCLQRLVCQGLSYQTLHLQQLLCTPVAKCVWNQII